ncbi:MAG: hypothetical protein N2444_05780 [Methylocystis sp.]|nr:hypothetical protein [Methylocystis sp.]
MSAMFKLGGKVTPIAPDLGETAMTTPHMTKIGARATVRVGLRQIVEVILLLGLLLGSVIALVPFVDIGLDALARQVQ